MSLPRRFDHRIRRLELVRYIQRHGLGATIFLADLVLLLLSIFLFLLAADYPDMARTFPRLVLAMIMVVIILDMINVIRVEKERTPSEETNKNREGIHPRQKLKVLYMIVLIYAFYLLMFFFGLSLGTFIFLLFSGWTLGYRKLKKLIFSSVIITAFVYVIFKVIMKSFLPEGLIFTILGG